MEIRDKLIGYKSYRLLNLAVFLTLGEEFGMPFLYDSKAVARACEMHYKSKKELPDSIILNRGLPDIQPHINDHDLLRYIERRFSQKPSWKGFTGDI